MMLKAVKELSVITDLPLSIDSSHVDVVEAALRIYPDVDQSTGEN